MRAEPPTPACRRPAKLEWALATDEAVEPVTVVLVLEVLTDLGLTLLEQDRPAIQGAESEEVEGKTAAPDSGRLR